MVDENSEAKKVDADAGEAGETQKEREDRASRAKAFYRAMYAGEDVAPTDFGMGNQGGGNNGPCQKCAGLEAQIADYEKRTLEAENLYKRMAADFENYRRRNDKEKEEFLGIGIQKGIEAILPAIDDMDRAKQSLVNVTEPKAFMDALNLVFNKLTRCLEGLGIKPLDVIGTPFDPRMHEPVQEIETQEVPDNAVVHELRRGYSFKDKVLRPSLVNVASNPSGVVVKKEPAPAAAEPAPSVPAPAPAASAEPAVSAAPAAAEVAVPQGAPAAAPEVVAEPAPAAAPEPAVQAAAPEPAAEVVDATAVTSVPDAPNAEPVAAKPVEETPVESKPAPAAPEAVSDSQAETAAMTIPESIKFQQTATADLPVFEIDAGELLIDERNKVEGEPDVYDLNITESEGESSNTETAQPAAPAKEE